MKLSIVTTLYKSKPFLETFLEETMKAIQTLSIKEFEIIVVNDGSPDDSLDYMIQRKKDIKEIIIVDLARNFGHHYALQAGLQYASGDFIFTVDNDLETPPSFLVDCYQEMINDPEVDVVFGYQEKRKGNFIENIGGHIFWILINKLSETKIPYNILTERIMRKKYVDELLRLNDANLFLDGMMHWVGFKQKGLPVKKGLREGNSTYTLRKRIQLMVQAITSFSGKPLEYLFYFGIVVSIFSFLFIIFLIVKKLIYGDEVLMGWTSLVAINVLILGIISTFLGMIGIYLFKIFRQVQGRPNYIIKRII